MTQPFPIPHAFAAVIDFAHSHGAKALVNHPGCWQRDVDGHWWIAINGHDEPTRCTRSDVPIEPFHCYVEFNGWPAGLLSPADGILAAGAIANEDAFIEALQANTKSESR